jgi:hypothetical protein
MIWAKIQEARTIPENLIKETVDLETIIVVIIERDGKFKNGGLKKSLAMRSMTRQSYGRLRRQSLCLLSLKN